LCGNDDLNLAEEAGHHAWHCGSECSPPVDTKVPVSQDIQPFRRAGLSASGGLHTAFFTRPIQAVFVPGTKVFMPFIVHHFIACTWGACYMSLFRNAIVPHLDTVEVLEYVLRSSVVVDDTADVQSRPPVKMYAELYRYLGQVESPAVREYLISQFEASHGRGRDRSPAPNRRKSLRGAGGTRTVI
jgi:hypothetical protein